METQTFMVGDKQVIIPTSHTQIKLNSFEKLIHLYSNEASDVETVLQKNIELLVTLSNLTEAEVEELDYADFKSLIQLCNNIDVLSYGDNIIEEFEIDGIKYASRVSEGEYKFSVKETLLLQNIFTKKETGYLAEIAAVIYHPIIDGQITFDYSVQSIAQRKAIFNDLTIDVIGPFINKLTEFLISKNA